MPRLHLDERLQTAADLFPACAYGADIGADHGRLSCYLLESGKCQRMCVTDVSAPSLKKAETLLSIMGLRDRADCLAGSGLSVLPHPAQAIAILGMGGHTMAEILTSSVEKLQGAALILSAHTDMDLIRRTLPHLHYRIDEERIAYAAGRYYVILRATPGEEAYTEKQCLLGPRFMETNAVHYEEYLAWQIRMTLPKRTEAARAYLQMLKEEQDRVRHCGHD